MTAAAAVAAAKRFSALSLTAAVVLSVVSSEDPNCPDLSVCLKKCLVDEGLGASNRNHKMGPKVYNL